VTADLASITGMQVPTSLLIGGEWTDGQAGVLPVVDPATEDPIAEVANASVEDALEAVTAAHNAGLTDRPVQDTVVATWAWLQAEGDPKPRNPVGLDPEKERQLLDSPVPPEI